MRVARATDQFSCKATLKDAEEGNVYCVEDAFQSLDGDHVITFTGFPKETNEMGLVIGFVAANFRKVEDIKLCVSAAEKAKQLVRQPV